MQSGIYPSVFKPAGVQVLVPDEDDQHRLHDCTNMVKSGTHDRFIRDTFQSLGARLAKAGAEAVILGCTEIPLVFDPGAVNYITLDPMRILARAAVDWAQGERQ